MKKVLQSRLKFSNVVVICCYYIVAFYQIKNKKHAITIILAITHAAL